MVIPTISLDYKPLFMDWMDLDGHVDKRISYMIQCTETHRRLGFYSIQLKLLFIFLLRSP